MSFGLTYIRHMTFLIPMLIIVTFFASGCSKQTETKPNNDISSTQVRPQEQQIQQEQKGQKGYLATFRDGAMFIQWTEVDKKISGQLQVAGLNNNKIESRTHPFNGITNGSNISINFSGSVWMDSLGGVTWTGTIESNKLTLVYPAKDGTLQTIAFRPGTVNDYNNTIGVLKDEGAIQESKEAYQKKQNDTRNNLNNLLIKLNKDTITLSSISFDKEIKSIKSSHETMQKQYTQLRARASVAPLTKYQLEYEVKYDLEYNLRYTLENDLLYNLNYGLGYTIKNAQEFSAYVSNEISALQNCWNDYLSSNRPDTQFNQDRVSSVIASARQEQSLLENRISSAQQEGNNYYSQGQQLYQTAKIFVSGLRSTGSD